MAEPDRTTYLHRTSTVACTLGGAGAAARGGEWLRLREGSGLAVEALPDGMRLWLEPRSRPAVEDLIRRESDCCGFLDFDLVAGDGRLSLDVTSPVPGAELVIRALLAGGQTDDEEPGGDGADGELPGYELRRDEELNPQCR